MEDPCRSVTRFGEILPRWQNLQCFGQFCFRYTYYLGKILDQLGQKGKKSLLKKPNVKIIYPSGEIEPWRGWSCGQLAHLQFQRVEFESNWCQQYLFYCKFAWIFSFKTPVCCNLYVITVISMWLIQFLCIWTTFETRVVLEDWCHIEKTFNFIGIHHYTYT